MITIFRKISLFVFLLVLASCQTTKSDGPTPGEIVSQYNLSNLTISISEEYKSSLFSLKEEQVALLRDGLTEKIRANLSASLPTKMKGPKAASVNVLLTDLHIASAGGKALLGQESSIRGTVSIIDDETQSLILTGQIIGGDGSAKVGQGSGLVGLAVAVVINTATSSDNTRTNNIAKSFDRNTNNWLRQKK